MYFTYTVFLSLHIIIQDFLFCAEFTVTPDSTVLGRVGGSVLLRWEYTSNTPIVYMKWFQTDEQNNPVKNIIIINNNDDNDNIEQDPIITEEYKTPVVRVFYNGSARIIISGLKLTDESLIACSVDFKGGQTIFNKIKLEIGTIPTETSVSQVGAVIENSDVIIKCETLSKPPAAITWRKHNNIKLSSSEKYKISSIVLNVQDKMTRSQSTLTISNIQKEDAGYLSCQSKNDLGAETSNMTLIVYYRPINTQLRIQYDPGLQGQSNIITCLSNAVPIPITYALYFENKIIFNSTSGVYKLASVQNYNQGTYKCIPRNFVGNGEEVVTEFKVNVAPLFQETSSNVIISNEDDSVTIWCKILTFPKTEVGWLKRNSTGSGDMNINTTTTYQNSSLILTWTSIKFSRVKRTDYGIYTCDAKNEFGQISKDIELIVHYKPAITLHTLPQPNFFLNDSSTTSETCIAKGLPQPKIKWYRDNVEIKNGGKHKIIITFDKTLPLTVKSIITLNSVNKDDSGILKCIASNSVGTDHQSTNFNIFNKAEIHGQLNQITYVNLGTSLSLSCVASGVKEPLISWFKNDLEIKSGTGNFLILANNVGSFSVSSILKINPVMKGDSHAEYKCVAANERGRDERKTSVSVYFGPSITDFPAASIITYEDKLNYEMLCVMQANPKPIISWYKSKTKINTADSTKYLLDERVVTQSKIVIMSSQLTLKKVTRGYFGNWTCAGENTIVGNIKSRTEKTTFLTVTYPPRYEFVTTSPFRANRSKTVIFICRVKASPKPFVWWELAPGVERDNRFSLQTTTSVDETQFGSVEGKLTIRNVQRKDVGDYICHTNNTIVKNTVLSRLIVQYAPSIQYLNDTMLYIRQQNVPIIITFLITSNPAPTLISFNKTDTNTTALSSVLHVMVKNRTDYKSFVSVTVTISRMSLSLNMAGVYIFNVCNVVSCTINKLSLFVFEAPLHELHLPHLINTSSLSSVTISCRIKSFPISNVIWISESETLNSITSVSYSRFFITVTATLHLHNITRDQASFYSCKASNFIGGNNEQTYLNVQYPPSVIPDFIESLYTVTERSIKFIEVLIDSNPISSAEWFISKGNSTEFKKIGKERIQSIQVAAIRDYEVKFKSRLSFENGVSRSDNARYKLIARNHLGKAETKTYIAIEWKPEPQTKLDKKQDAMLGTSPSFICRFLSNPESVIKWFKNGELFTKVGYRTTTLRYNSSVTLSQSVLTFLDVTKADTGNYTCEAKNRIGKSIQWKTLNVLYAPIALDKLQNKLVDPGETLALYCFADANPPVTRFHWTRMGGVLNHNSQKLTVPSINKETAGVYTCTPSNNLGNDSITYNVSVRIHPTFLKPASCVKKENLHCECSGTGFPQPLIYWTKYPSNLQLSSTTQLNITIQPKTDGTYYCHLKNSKGDVRTSVRIANFVDYVSAWGIWGTCNSTCGVGYQSKTRACNVAPCPELLVETNKCSVPCKGTQADDEVNWLYTLFALIPCVILFVVLVGLWIVRLNRYTSKRKQIVVKLNQNITRPPMMMSAQNKLADNVKQRINSMFLFKPIKFTIDNIKNDLNITTLLRAGEEEIKNKNKIALKNIFTPIALPNNAPLHRNTPGVFKQQADNTRVKLCKMAEDILNET